ncbi:hypothetical protein CVT26_004166, partial [Gymnopilus dilepis]
WLQGVDEAPNNTAAATTQNPAPTNSLTADGDVQMDIAVPNENGGDTPMDVATPSGGLSVAAGPESVGDTGKKNKAETYRLPDPLGPHDEPQLAPDGS